jgi:hypothetical protein
MSASATPVTLVVRDEALGDATGVFAEAVAYLARRFERVAPLDPSSLPTDPAEAVAALDRWAGEGAANWRQELIRFYEAHAPVLLRTDAALNARIRSAVASGSRFAVASPLPTEAAELFVGQLGLRRAISHVCGGPTAVEDARTALSDPAARVAGTRAELDAILS